MRLPPALDLLRGCGVSIEEAREAKEDCLDRIGFLEDLRSCSSRSEKSSVLLPFRKSCVPPSSSFSFALCSASYIAPTCDRYGLNSAGSTVWILVRVTGGISRAVGGLCALDDGAEVCGMSPVRTMGGWRRVDMAKTRQ